MTVMTPAARTQTIAFLSSGAKEANEALERLTALYGNSPFDEASVIVALGGDGLMLQTLHMIMERAEADLRHEPRIGGLPDERISEAALPERLGAAQPSIIHPLLMRATRHQRRRDDSASHQRSVAVAPDPIRRRNCASRSTDATPRRTRRRRPARFNAGRLDRL